MSYLNIMLIIAIGLLIVDLAKRVSRRKIWIRVGSAIDVIHLGGCMDQELSRSRGVIKERRSCWQRHAKTTYIYIIKFADGTTRTAHSSWCQFNAVSGLWEFRN